MRRSHQRLLTGLLALAWLLSAPSGDARAEGPPRPRLAALEIASDAQTVRARGSDPAGPRALELWSWREGRFARLARTRSAADGRFDFGELPVPHEALWLAVSARGRRPHERDRIRVERGLAAPRLVPELGEPARELAIHPARREGELRIRDARSGRLLLRWPVEASGRGPVHLDLLDALGPALPSAVWIDQVLDDGRRSEPAFLDLEPDGAGGDVGRDAEDGWWRASGR